MTAGRRPDRAHRRAQRGVILLGVLVMLGLMAALSAEVGMRWADERQRADEEELLFVGEQYRQAIESYWRSTPGGMRQWPTRLEDLVDDNRFPQPKHHLRKLFRDPMAPDQPWGLLQVGSAIVGVYSQSEATPFRQTGFSVRQAKFASAQSYADWKFAAVVSAGPVPPAVNKPPPGVAPKPPAPGTPNRPNRRPSS